MKFLFSRERTVVSTKGHAIRFPKGELVHVPKDMYPEVLAAGGVPENELEEDEKKPEIVGDERHAKLLAAIAKVVEENNPEDFTAAGIPNRKKLGARVGFAVGAEEFERAYGEFLTPKD